MVAYLDGYLPWFMIIHGYSCLLYSRISMVQIYKGVTIYRYIGILRYHFADSIYWYA